MIAVTILTPTAQALANRYAAAARLLDDTIARRADRLLAGPMLSTARATAPVLTGALRASLRPVDAEPVGVGTLEGVIKAGVPYADDVVASQPRGRRDYPYATVIGTTADVQAAADGMARDVAELLEGTL